MDDAVNKVLADYHTRPWKSMVMASGPEAAAILDDLLLPVGPETGTVLNLLARGLGAQTIVELGTSHGYSTVYLAEAARATGGKVITFELAEKKTRYAREQLARAGLEQFVEFRVGSALDNLPNIPGPIDFVLVDVWKELYIPCLEIFYGKLAKGALVAADNMLYPEFSRADAEGYRRRVRELDFDSVLLNIGSGVELSRRR